MKKLFLGLTVLLLATGVVFAKGHCKIHGDFAGSRCTQCAWDTGYVGGSEGGNYDSTGTCNTNSFTNEQKVECIRGYNTGYTEAANAKNSATQNQKDTTSN